MAAILDAILDLLMIYQTDSYGNGFIGFFHLQKPMSKHHTYLWWIEEKLWMILTNGDHRWRHLGFPDNATYWQLWKWFHWISWPQKHITRHQIYSSIVNRREVTDDFLKWQPSWTPYWKCSRVNEVHLADSENSPSGLHKSTINNLHTTFPGSGKKVVLAAGLTRPSPLTRHFYQQVKWDWRK